MSSSKLYTTECIPNQIELSPRNIEGFGLSDGEGTERLWSYLRRFSAMTKEMRPSHRMDVLTDAVLFYAHKSSSNMGKMCRFYKQHCTDQLHVIDRETACEAHEACL